MSEQTTQPRKHVLHNSALLADNAIIQRDKPITLSGYACPHSRITISLHQENSTDSQMKKASNGESAKTPDTAGSKFHNCLPSNSATHVDNSAINNYNDSDACMNGTARSNGKVGTITNNFYEKNDTYDFDKSGFFENADANDSCDNVSYIDSDENGYWNTTLKPHCADLNTYSLHITTDSQEMSIHNIMFGDVWLLGGQSNMQLWLSRLACAFPHVVNQAHDDLIRMFIVPETQDFQQERDEIISGHWERSGTDDVSLWSGVGYFFAQQLRQQHHVPIGLVQTALGGTSVESWMSKEACGNVGIDTEFTALYSEKYMKETGTFFAQLDSNYAQLADSLDDGLTEGWQHIHGDDSQWEDFNFAAPESEQRIAHDSGVIWFRKQVTIPDEFVGKPAELRFGTLVDADEFYLNGKRIGSTAYRYPPRNYAIEALPQHCDITIRMISQHGEGCFSQGKQHCIVVTDTDDPTENGKLASQTILDIDAMGPAKARRSTYLPNKPDPIFFSRYPVGNFNGMISPLRNLSFAGVLWYQGESNTAHPAQYAKKFAELIACWRKAFKDPYLPFLFVQLPNIDITSESSHNWAFLRNEQRKTLALTKNAAMAVTVGAGEDADLHPLDKKTVAERLAIAAQALYYAPKEGKNSVEYMGPLVESAILQETQLTLSFTHCGSGLSSSTAIALDFVCSENKAENNHNQNDQNDQNDSDTRTPNSCVTDKGLYQVQLDTTAIRIELEPSLAKKMAERHYSVRYGWANSPKLTIQNREGLLASPFEVDITTVEKQQQEPTKLSTPTNTNTVAKERK